MIQIKRNTANGVSLREKKGNEFRCIPQHEKSTEYLIEFLLKKKIRIYAREEGSKHEDKMTFPWKLNKEALTDELPLSMRCFNEVSGSHCLNVVRSKYSAVV